MRETRTIGERDRRYQDYLKGLRRMGGLPRLVVDNTYPVPARGSLTKLRGIRVIYGDGGPDNAA